MLKKNSGLLWNPKIHYRVHKRPLQDPALISSVTPLSIPNARRPLNPHVIGPSTKRGRSHMKNWQCLLSLSAGYRGEGKTQEGRLLLINGAREMKRQDYRPYRFACFYSVHVAKRGESTAKQAMAVLSLPNHIIIHFPFYSKHTPSLSLQKSNHSTLEVRA